MERSKSLLFNFKTYNPVFHKYTLLHIMCKEYFHLNLTNDQLLVLVQMTVDVHYLLIEFQVIQLNINMSLLSAGKQISVGNDRAYGRGLFIPDPEEAERKALKKLEYQEQLRIQMEEAKRRKQQQKRKEQEEDKRLEQKINEDMKKEAERKDGKGQAKNDKNIAPPKLAASKVDPPREEQRQRRHEEIPNYKFQLRNRTEADRPIENNYLSKRFDPIQAEEERFYDDSNSQRLRGMRQALQEKMIEVYKKIKQSQNLEIDKEIDLIRKKIASSNTNYDNQNPKVPEFEGEISYFYKIPKKINVIGDSRMVKNLNYDSTSYVKRGQNSHARQDLKPVTQQKMQLSRQNQSRQSRDSNDQKIWGLKRGKGNYLNDRQAMDLQINSIMGKIDNLLDQKSYR